MAIWGAMIVAAVGVDLPASSALAQTKPAAGPLRVLPTNPRYFTDGTGRAVYLTGSHVWNNWQDQGITSPPPEFDFQAYLDFLNGHGHNFIRLWRFEITEWAGWNENEAPLRYTAQHPWKRTGPGMALDGLPKFDFAQWDEAHFERLRSRVQAAGERGIYVSVMLFEGWSQRTRPSTWVGHPMNAANNINGIDGDPNGDGRGLEVEMLQEDSITKLQQAYIRKVVDAVNDLDNVLYEISNESLYTPEFLKWQVAMIDYVNEYQAGQPQQHPVGITNLVAYAKASTPAVALARPAMGHTQAYSERIDLAATTPRDDLASTTYCLAIPGQEYLVYLPEGGEATVDLSAAQGHLAAEWFNPRTGEKQVGDRALGGAKRSRKAPFAGDAVLYLRSE